MLKRKRKKKLTLLRFEPTPLNSNVVEEVILAYLNTPQSKGDVLHMF
jgi:hypothetical protein